MTENLPGDPFACLTKNLPLGVRPSYDEDMTDSHRTTGAHCTVHPETALICPRCIAAKGGKSRSKAKVAASRKNSQLGAIAARKLARERRKAKKLAEPSTAGL